MHLLDSRAFVSMHWPWQFRTFAHGVRVQCRIFPGRGVRMFEQVDTSEDALGQLPGNVLDLLLRDRTTGGNIIWATDQYADLGPGYGFGDPIVPARITGEHGQVIRPRAIKSRAEQTGRTKAMAEVFTPSWVCNAQNNVVDEAWFGRKDVFNVEDAQAQTWAPVTSPIVFPEGKSWQHYVRDTRMEIACGEAPYLVSRYDTTTGEPIPLGARIGMLDRKLRVISENVTDPHRWLTMALEAYRSIYAFEWQGDSLLLAREALLVSLLEYYEAQFGAQPPARAVLLVAGIVSWNVWQMDGLRGVVPGSCRHRVREARPTLFGAVEEEVLCPGCQRETYQGHNGTYCLIRDWGQRDPRTGAHHRVIRFIDLIR